MKFGGDLVRFGSGLYFLSESEFAGLENFLNLYAAHSEHSKILGILIQHLVWDGTSCGAMRCVCIPDTPHKVYTAER
jgi:hypothetical protein